MIEKSMNYNEFINQIKNEIKQSQNNAILSVNRELLLLYWKVGRRVLENINSADWGSKIIPKLSKELKQAFPDLKGFSERNLKYMRRLAEEYPDFVFVQQVVAQLSWSHNLVLLDRIKDKNERQWYMEKCISNGWSRNILVHQIETNLYMRQQLVDKTSNYEQTLESPNSLLAVDVLKDPYVFDFIAFEENMKERDIEKQLVKKITSFLLELGSGFAFIGNQYHLQVGQDDFYIDLLFYHIKLKSYVVIELKTGKFKAEYAGKLNFYLSAVDDLIKGDDDNPSIGIILCKEKNKLVAEYALKDMTKPIGVSEYKLLERVPEELESSLPSIEELEKELEDL